MPDFHDALRQLNAAAYAALRSAKSTPGLTAEYRESLRCIAHETDKAVDTAPAREAAE